MHIYNILEHAEEESNNCPLSAVRISHWKLMIKMVVWWKVTECEENPVYTASLYAGIRRLRCSVILKCSDKDLRTVEHCAGRCRCWTTLNASDESSRCRTHSRSVWRYDAASTSRL